MATDKLKKFNKRWNKVQKLSGIVKALDDSKDYEDAFNGSFRDLLEFYQTNYGNRDDNDAITEEMLNLASLGDIRQKLELSMNLFKSTRVRETNYGLRNLDNILDGLHDESPDNLNAVAISLIPIKDTDLDRADDLEGLINSYDEIAETLKDNLTHINRNTHPQRYEEQEKTIQEYKEFKSLLQDYKGLVKGILDYKKIEAPLIGQRGRPDNAKMKELFDAYLDELAEKYKAEKKDKYDNNSLFIEALKDLSGNPHYLPGYYLEGVLNPTKEKLDSVAKTYDLKKYVKRNVNVMDNNKQMQFFDVMHSVTTKKAA